MIIFNKNFSLPCIKTINSKLLESFNTTSPTANVEYMTSTTGTLAVNSTVLQKVNTVVPTTEKTYSLGTVFNFYIVTKELILALDNFYAKMWNNSIPEDSFYIKENILSVFKNFNSAYNTDNLVSLINRMVDAGFMDTKYRLDPLDCISLANLVKSEAIKVQNDSLTSVQKLAPTKLVNMLDKRSNTYLNSKEIYFMVTPFFNKETSLDAYLLPVWSGVTTFHQQYNLFKAPTASKFGSNIPMGTHLFFKFSNPEEKEIYTLEGKDETDIVYDHTDVITHFDQLKFSLANVGVRIQSE